MTNDQIARWVTELRRIGVKLVRLDGSEPDGPTYVRAFAMSSALLGSESCSGSRGCGCSYCSGHRARPAATCDDSSCTDHYDHHEEEQR